MKIKILIALSENLTRPLKAHSRSLTNRSGFIGASMWAYVERLKRRVANSQDLELINRRADALNAEAADVLEYQGTVLR